jgi:hypothetical protein
MKCSPEENKNLVALCQTLNEHGCTPHPNWHWMNKAKFLRETVGIPYNDAMKLPPAFEGEIKFMGFKIVVKKTFAVSRRKVSNHRVFVCCPCGREIPLGRISQHLYAKEHQED